MKTQASGTALEPRGEGWLAALEGIVTRRSAAVDYIIRGFYCFLFIYNVSFWKLPSVTTGRVVLFVLTLWYGPRVLAELKDFIQNNVPVVFTFLFLLCYSILLYILSGLLDSTQVSRALHFLLYVIFGSIVFSVAFEHDARRFVSAFALATLVQAAFIGFSYISADYRVWLSELVVQGGNIPLTNGTQVPGFSNSSGAALSVIQSLGVFAVLYCAKSAKSFRSSIAWALASVPIGASTIVTGRTGLMLAVIFAGAFLLIGRAKQRLALFLLGAGLLLIAFLAADSILDWVSQANPDVQNLGAWAFEIFQRGTDATSWQDLLSQPVPPLTFDRLFGTGLVIAQDGVGNESGNDSGYVQTYYALGLIMALVFYAAVLAMLGKFTVLSHDKFLFGILLVFLFVIEVKEPFIYKYTYPFLILTAASLSHGQYDPASHSGRVNKPVPAPARS